MAAGCRPRFADVDPGTGMITLETVQERFTITTRAVVFIHLYGQTADLGPLAAWCQSMGIALIEDVAQAQGAVLPNGTAAGSAGDMAVFSFNRTKILDCGGGLLVLRPGRFADIWKNIAGSGLPTETDSTTLAQLALSHRNLYHSLISLRRVHRVVDIASVFLPLQSYYADLYVRSLNRTSGIIQSWPELEAVLEDRRRKASVYASILPGGPWRCLDGWRSSGACWRYSLLVDTDRTIEFTEAVRRDGFQVSNLYWPLNDLFNPEDVCPNAERFARQVMNLWVDRTVTVDEAEACARSLWSHVSILMETSS